MVKVRLNQLTYTRFSVGLSVARLKHSWNAIISLKYFKNRQFPDKKQNFKR